MSELDLDYVESWAGGDGESYSFHAEPVPLVADVRDWDYTIDIRGFVPGASPAPAEADGLRTTWDEDIRAIVVWDGHPA